MSLCPVRCAWHQAAERWLREGNQGQLAYNLMTLDRVRQTMWRRCICGLWGRIRRAVG